MALATFQIQKPTDYHLAKQTNDLLTSGDIIRVTFKFRMLSLDTSSQGQSNGIKFANIT